ncbi:MAG: GNAT family N-acetyltransferase [Chloroflexi bacterium]|nr:MAG: GNAT family N-acetyltransferase [Chloroflexota bacterium]
MTARPSPGRHHCQRDEPADAPDNRVNGHRDPTIRGKPQGLVRCGRHLLWPARGRRGSPGPGGLRGARPCDRRLRGRPSGRDGRHLHLRPQHSRQPDAGGGRHDGAILWASEATIYGRFGYGLATFKASIEIERARAGFREQHIPRGTFRLLEPDEATAACRPIYDRHMSMRVGSFSRNDGWWRAEFAHDPERWRRGGGPAFFLVHETDGAADAYARYRIHSEWDDRGPKGSVDVQEAIALNPIAERELWAYLFSVDLSAKTRAFNVPVDWGMRFMLSEPRRLGMTIGDAVWLRIVDLPAALERRSYAGNDRLILEVKDAFCPWNAGRWQLEVAPDGPRVTRTDSDPDLILEAGDLGSTYLGGVSLAELALAGRVEECTPGAVGRADALLRTPLAPWCPAVF